MDIIANNNLDFYKEYSDATSTEIRYDTARNGYKQMIAAYLRGEFSRIVVVDLQHFTCQLMQAALLLETVKTTQPLTLLTTEESIHLDDDAGRLYFKITIAKNDHTIITNSDVHIDRTNITPHEFSIEYDHLGSCMFRCATCNGFFFTDGAYYVCPQCNKEHIQHDVDYAVTTMIAQVCDRALTIDGVQYAPDNAYLQRITRSIADTRQQIINHQDDPDLVSKLHVRLKCDLSAQKTNRSHSQTLIVPDNIPDKRTFLDADPLTQRSIIDQFATISIRETKLKSKDHDYFEPKQIIYDWKIAANSS